MTRVKYPIITKPILTSGGRSTLDEISARDFGEKSDALKSLVDGLLNDSTPVGSRNYSNTIDGGAGYSFIYNYLANSIVQTYNLEELDIYGTSRAGTVNPDLQLYANTFSGTVSPDGATQIYYTLNPYTPSSTDASKTNRLLGNKSYELSNHLGNDLVTVSDRKISHSMGGVNIDYYTADIQTSQDYYAFGAPISDRTYSFSSTVFRYGFNGKEKDDEAKGVGAQYDYGMRVYDSWLAKFMSVDPLTSKYAYLTPYQFASNTPIQGIDLDGREVYYFTFKEECGKPKLELQGIQTMEKVQVGFHKVPIATEDGIVIYDYVPNYELQKIKGQKFIVRDSYKESIYESTHHDYTFNTLKDAYNASLNDLTKTRPRLWLFYLNTALFTEGGGGDFAILEELGEAAMVLKGAGQLYKCTEYAEAFSSEFAEGLKASGATLRQMECQAGADFGISIGDKTITKSGYHIFTEVTAGNQTYIYDNIYPKGIPKADYIKNLYVVDPNTKTIKTGQQAFDIFKSKQN
jgi:RHS repeat-associated protein